MKTVVFALLCLLLLGCKTQDTYITETLQVEGFKHGVTKKKNNANIFINGFKSAHIIHDSDGLALSELQFHSTVSIVETSKVMVNNFGVWEKRLAFYNEDHHAFVWEHVQLLKSTSQKFTVITDGKKGNRIQLSSVMVMDQENNDCLARDYPLRDAIISYFSDEIKKVQPYEPMRKAYSEFRKTN